MKQKYVVAPKRHYILSEQHKKSQLFCLDCELKTTWKILHLDVIQELIIALLIHLDCFECEISQINILFLFLLFVVEN